MILLVLLIIFLFSLQLALFSTLGVSNIVIQPLLIVLILLFCYDTEYTLFTAIIAGLLFDIFSSRTFGEHLLIFLFFYILAVLFLSVKDRVARRTRSLILVFAFSFLLHLYSSHAAGVAGFSSIHFSIYTGLLNTILAYTSIKLIDKYSKNA